MANEPKEEAHWPFEVVTREIDRHGNTTYHIGGQVFSAAEWADMEEHRRAIEGQLVAERGQAWVDEHRRMLIAQWEYAIFIGLVGA